VLGQTVLGFELSIAQILVSVVTCAVLEVGITCWRRRIIMWPASALLTGNGVAFILRVPGTRYGAWWSLRGAGLFAGVATVSVLSKYLIRRGGRHLFNPSNIGLVLCFVLLGTRRANPQDLWWGAMSAGLLLTLGVIVIGGLVIVSKLRMLGLALAFWITFAASTGVVAASGHCMEARWRVGPLCGRSFWSVLVTSPEILVFLFFMITDPKTAPRGSVGRVVYGTAVALLGALLLAPARTEFSTKVAVLAGLSIVCAVGPLLDRVLPVPGSDADHLGAWFSSVSTGPLRVFGAAGLAVTLCAGLFAAGSISARPAAAAGGAAVTPSVIATRPAVAIAPSAVPAVAVDASVQAANPAVTGQVARRMGHDIAEDLAIESEAIRRQLPGLAATAAAGAQLDSVLNQIDAARLASRFAVPSYRFDRMTVVLVPDHKNPQASPGIGVEVHGTVELDTYGRSSSTAVLARRESVYARTLLLVLAGGHYLIASDGTP
jgi:Na+-translocating ferredoxin:NAD+ oxidoreductase RnfD subunit